jgi:toxin ParE1/3/4
VRVDWSPRALEQAEAAFDYIAADRPHAAADWLSGLFERVDLLLEFPLQGRHVPEADRAEVRELIYEGYRIVYRVDVDRMIVLLLQSDRRPMNADEL